jgi:hypothetical protein
MTSHYRAHCHDFLAPASREEDGEPATGNRDHALHCTFSVLTTPEHPYTRLLLESIPSPDPDIRWTSDATELAGLEQQAGVSRVERFVDTGGGTRRSCGRG